MTSTLPRCCRTWYGKPKRCWRTEADALADPGRDATLALYTCAHCGNVHTGHAPGPAQPRRRLSRSTIRAELRGSRG